MPQKTSYPIILTESISYPEEEVLYISSYCVGHVIVAHGKMSGGSPLGEGIGHHGPDARRHPNVE